MAFSSAITEIEAGNGVGMVAAIAILFILLLTLAGLSIAVVNAMFFSPWGTFVVFATMPIAFVMGRFYGLLTHSIIYAELKPLCRLRAFVESSEGRRDVRV